MASCKATDAVYKVEVPSAGKKLRELFYMAHYLHSHIAHFYALAAPDFVCGPDAPPAERNILGVVAKVGLEIGGQVIKARAYAQDIQAMLGGKATHPVGGIPGGMSKPITQEERQKIEDMAASIVEFAKFSLKLFEDVVLKNQGYVDLILSDAFTIKTNYMGLVDKDGKVNFYDGQLRVTDPDGNKLLQFEPADYLNHIAERVEPWTYLKFPFLKAKGWQGIVKLEVRIESDGRISRLRVEQTSGYPLLDRAALQALRLASVPDAEQWMKGQAVDIIIPVEYRLVGG